MTAVPHPLTQAPPSSLVQCCKLPLQLLQLVFHTFLKPNLVSMALTWQWQCMYSCTTGHCVFVLSWLYIVITCIVLVGYCRLCWLVIARRRQTSCWQLSSILSSPAAAGSPPCCCCFVSTSFHLSANSPPPQPQHIDMLHTLNHFNTPKTFLTPCCCSARRSLSPH